MITNYGITISEICATCKFKMIGRETHKCKLNGKAVRRDHRCAKYEILPWMMRIGKGDGRVKPKEVLMEKLEMLCGIKSRYIVKNPVAKTKGYLKGGPTT